jgi:hypothetical protein
MHASIKMPMPWMKGPLLLQSHEVLDLSKPNYMNKSLYSAKLGVRKDKSNKQ